MKIVADEKIPLIADYFGFAEELVLKPGRALTRSDVMTADILIVRSVTTVNADLLVGTRVKFVGSVASGIDHLDTVWLENAGIQWAAATGCNATAVVEYVICVIAALQQQGLLQMSKPRAAVIGVGRIGSQVAALLEQLGFAVLLCDPVRAASETDFVSIPLAEIADCDFITIHTPLTHDGAFPTFHLLDANFLNRQKDNAVLVNAARGAVIHSNDLKNVKTAARFCLDVWENEPVVDANIVKRATIATPHIAGHTRQAKQRGIDMIYRTLLESSLLPAQQRRDFHLPKMRWDFHQRQLSWQAVVLSIYNPLQTTQLMHDKMLGDNGSKGFDAMRNDFNHRDEFAFCVLDNLVTSSQDKTLLLKLGCCFH